MSNPIASTSKAGSARTTTTSSSNVEPAIPDALFDALNRSPERRDLLAVPSAGKHAPPSPSSPSKKGGWRSAFRREKSIDSMRHGADSTSNSRLWPEALRFASSSHPKSDRPTDNQWLVDAQSTADLGSIPPIEKRGGLGLTGMQPIHLSDYGPPTLDADPKLGTSASTSPASTAPGNALAATSPISLKAPSIASPTGSVAGTPRFDESPVAPFLFVRSKSDGPNVEADESLLDPVPEHEEPRVTHPPSATDFVVAIIGPRNVGKSTVVRRGLKRPMNKPVVVVEDGKGNQAVSLHTYFHIASQPRSIEVLEIDSPLLLPSSAALGSANEQIVWPADLPLPDGIMVCYDATNRSGFESLPALLNLIFNRGLGCPLIVLACKSEPTGDAVDLAMAAQRCNAWGAAIAPLEGGVEDRDKKCKSCFNWMIRRIMKNRGELRPTATASEDDHEAQARREPSTLDFASFLDTSDDHGSSSKTPNFSVVGEAPVATGPSRTPSTAPSQVQRGPPSSAGAHDEYHSRDAVIGKFLFTAVSGDDEKQVATFLTVFRRFARPYDVLSSLIERFTFVSGRMKTDPLMARYAQIKLCGLLSTWLHTYPGDFSAPATLRLLKPFLDSLLPRGATHVAHYAVELSPLVASLDGMDDPDASWALPDKSLESPVLVMSDTPPRDASEDTEVDDLAEDATQLDLTDDGLKIDPADEVDDVAESSHDNQSSVNTPSVFASESTPSLRGRPRSGSDAGTLTTLDSTDLAKSTTSSAIRASGKQFVPDDVLLQTSNAVADADVDALATQITRIAWEAYRDITPRDLIKHILAPRDPKNLRAMMRDENSPVVRAIEFFNYLADWVSTLVLAQKKLKHRARLIEKLVNVAIKLRGTDNYDSLMAVLAGLNAQPLYRLNESFEAVWSAQPDNKFKNKYLSLNKLMGTSRSFAAYRLALQSSHTGFLPYLGVHLQDLTALHEVKQDMKDGLVNWTKFQQMGQAASVVRDCRKMAREIALNKEIEHLILAVPILGKESQYALSYGYQPRADAGSRSKLRQFVDKALT